MGTMMTFYKAIKLYFSHNSFGASNIFYFLGSPNPLMAMMLRCISEVPPPIFMEGAVK